MYDGEAQVTGRVWPIKMMGEEEEGCSSKGNTDGRGECNTESQKWGIWKKGRGSKGETEDRGNCVIKVIMWKKKKNGVVKEIGEKMGEGSSDNEGEDGGQQCR